MATRSHASLSLVVGRNDQAATDAELARSLIAGEGWAVTETWRRFAPMVLMTAERTLGSKTEAEDLAQEVFYRLFRRAHTLRDVGSLRSFVYSFAVRLLKTELRYRKVRAWLSFRQPDALLDFGSDTLDVESRDLLRRLYVLLDRLSARDRLVFILRRAESMTVEEIARTMELSVSTVKRSMTRASSQLSRWVAADPGLAAALPRARFGGLE